MEDQQTLWAFHVCPCTHESAYALVSLHRTKAGAWKAKHAYQLKDWLENRDFELSFLPRRLRDGYPSKAYMIAPVTVQD